MVYVPIFLLPELINRFTQSLSEGKEGEEKTFFEHLGELRQLYCNPTTFGSAIRSTRILFSIEKTRLAALKHVVFTKKQATKMQRRWKCHIGRLQVPLTGPWDTFLLGRSRILIDDVASELTSQRSYRAKHGVRISQQGSQFYNKENGEELARYVLLNHASRREEDTNRINEFIIAQFQAQGSVLQVNQFNMEDIRMAEKDDDEKEKDDEIEEDDDDDATIRHGSQSTLMGSEDSSHTEQEENKAPGELDVNVPEGPEKAPTQTMLPFIDVEEEMHLEAHHVGNAELFLRVIDI